ncbi:MAG TPA: periplasmic heavy metal sensor [Pyrinomonadaceae bacterium]|jgi:Spy/CpxP family protein refolding chaperone|nr:periplasmic heavy metal sensor [Pyrinomonadaceae bacterium]
MDKLKRNTWLVRVAAIAIFVLGFAAGALAPRAYRAWDRGGPQGERGDRIERLKGELDLTPEQVSQVRQIFGDTRAQLQALRKESEPRFAEIRRQADERMRQVLTPEQWEQFQKTRDKGGRRGRGGRGGGDGERKGDGR